MTTMENQYMKGAMQPHSAAAPPAYEDLLKDEENRYGDAPVDRGAIIFVRVDPVSPPDSEQLVLDARTRSSTQGSAVTAEDMDYWMGSSFQDKNIRRSFIRKVFLILMCQLVVTIGVICLFIFCTPVKSWIHTSGNVWFYYAAYGTFLATYIILACCRNVQRHWPWNFVCLTLFTLSLSCLAGTISSYHDTRIVLIAFGITAAVCLSLSLFSIQTKIDVTLCSSMLFAFWTVVFFFGLYCIITGSILGFRSHYILTGVWGGLVALLFSMFLVFDIQLVIGGKSIELSPEEYIYGALHIYLDVVYLFLMILSCVGRSN